MRKQDDNTGTRRMDRKRRAGWSWPLGMAVSVLILGAGPAAAAGGGEQARELIQQARDDIAGGLYGAAVGKLERSFALVADPDVLLELARAYDRWGGHCDDALLTYDRYFEVCDACLTLEEARRRAAEVTKRCQASVHVNSDPPGASVRIDGEEHGKCPLTLQLVAGRHNFAVYLRGYQDHQEILVVEARKEREVKVTLHRAVGDVAELLFQAVPPDTELRVDDDLVTQPLDEPYQVAPGAHVVKARHASGANAHLNATVERGDRFVLDVGRALGPVPDMTAKPGRDASSRSSPIDWPWVGISLGGAGLAIGAIFGTLAGSALRARDIAVAEAAWPDAGSHKAEIVDHEQAAEQRAMIANFAWGFGLAAVIGGCIALALPEEAPQQGGGARKADGEPAARWTPVFTPAGVGVTGAF